MGNRALSSLLGAFHERLQAGTQRQSKAVLLGPVPRLQDRQLVPWPAVAVPMSGGEGLATSEPCGVPRLRVVPVAQGYSDAANALLLVPGYPKPERDAEFSANAWLYQPCER